MFRKGSQHHTLTNIHTREEPLEATAHISPTTYLQSTMGQSCLPFLFPFHLLLCSLFITLPSFLRSCLPADVMISDIFRPARKFQPWDPIQDFPQSFLTVHHISLSADWIESDHTPMVLRKNHRHNRPKSEQELHRARAEGKVVVERKRESLSSLSPPSVVLHLHFTFLLHVAVVRSPP